MQRPEKQPAFGPAEVKRQSGLVMAPPKAELAAVMGSPIKRILVTQQDNAHSGTTQGFAAQPNDRGKRRDCDEPDEERNEILK
jgi:hypothetical protein